MTAGSPAFLRAWARYVPERVVTNDEAARLFGCEAEWIRSTSGIDERRYAADDEGVVELAVRAGRAVLERADGAAVGFVIVATGTAERRFPGPAALVSAALGLGTVPAIDLPMPSAGGLFGIALAARLAATFEHVLVIAAERMSGLVQRPGTNPQVAVLFGDGAGACLVSHDGGRARIVDSMLHSDGNFAGALEAGFETPMVMEGRTVIMQAARKLPQAIADLLRRHAIAESAVDAFLLHQANQNLTRQVAKTIGVPESRCFSNIARYGNTSSASVLIALAEWADETGFHSRSPVVMAAFGAGLHWGSILLDGHV